LDEASNNVKRIFIRTMKAEGDSIVAGQYNWKAGRSFLINTSVIRKDGSKSSVQHLVNWNDDINTGK